VTPRVAILILIIAAHIGCAGSDPEPNLLLITLDTTRSDHFGFSGHQAARTPHFDNFVAERGISFENAISAVPVTFPSHTTILTGTYPVFHGVHDNDGYFLDDSVTTLAEILKPQGFTTGAVLAAFPLDSEVNLDQGFDTYDDDYQADWTQAEIEASGPFSFGFPERKADRVNQAVDRWLEENWRDRFFLWVHYFDPHQPYNPPAPYDSLFSSELYDGEMAFLDENFGLLLDMLEMRGLIKNTIIVIVGDHGEALYDHSEPTHAHFIYDSTIRVPLIFAVPGDRFRTGLRVPSQVRTADVAPTVLDLLGLPPGSDMQGTSLVPLLEDPNLEWSKPALIENYYNLFHFGWAPMRGLRTDRFKFVEAPEPELYDLEADPGELTNLAPNETQEVAKLRGRLQGLVQEYEHADLGRSTAAQIDDETRQKLEALGYLGSDSTASERAAPFPETDDLASLIDPKKMTPVLMYLNFINEMLRAQRFDDALPVIHNALALDPANPKLYLHLSRSLAALGRWEGALEAAQHAQTLRPEDAEALAITGRILARRGRYEEAITPLSRAVELYPQHIGTLRQLAAVYLAADRIDDAISHFETVIGLDESNWTSLIDLATAYSRLGKWQQARDRLQQALDINPYSSTVRYRIAVFYREVGNPDFSRRMLEDTLRIAPDHIAANLDLGELLLADGDLENGRRHLELVVERAPQTSWGVRASKLIEETSSD